LFQGCQSCHDTGLGPSLDGVIGRPAGWLRSFDHYSDEMRSSGLVWNLEQLRQYIANPSALVPGNQMSRLHFDGLQEDETEAVVAHLYSDPRYEFFVQAPLLCVDAAATKFASE
jgi:cytochrome c